MSSGLLPVGLGWGRVGSLHFSPAGAGLWDPIPSKHSLDSPFPMAGWALLPPWGSSSLREVQPALGPPDTCSLGSGTPTLTVTAVGSCPPALLKGCPLGRASHTSLPLLRFSGAWPVLVRPSLPLPCPAPGLPDQAAAPLGLGGLPEPSLIGFRQLYLGPSICHLFPNGSASEGLRLLVNPGSGTPLCALGV